MEIHSKSKISTVKRGICVRHSQEPLHAVMDSGRRMSFVKVVTLFLTVIHCHIQVSTTSHYAFLGENN